MVRYFEKFQDMPHRIELAFEIFRLAKILYDKNLYAIDLWNPNKWFIIESVSGIQPYFGGFGTLMSHEDMDVLRIKNDAIKDYSHTNHNTFYSPDYTKKNNKYCAIVYALLLAGGFFDSWKPDEHGFYQFKPWLTKEWKTIYHSLS